jgi:hypothetical protein
MIFFLQQNQKNLTFFATKTKYMRLYNLYVKSNVKKCYKTLF